MKKKSLLLLVLSLSFATMLAGCTDDSSVINYPDNESSSIFTIEGDDGGDVTGNLYSDLYKNLTGSNSKSAQMLDNMLYNFATSKYLTGDSAITDAQIQKRYEKEMLDTVKGGSYSTDNYFDEYRYALSLRGQMYTIKTAGGSSDLADIRAACTPLKITPDLEWADVFKLDYTDYIKRSLKPSIVRRYLNGYYIYNQSYTSIGNTLARGVKIVKITDRSDKPGEALKLINGFITDFISNKSASAEDADLLHLAKLWKGVDLDAADQALITKYNVSTLSDKIDEEVAKIKLNPYTTDSTLEATYTGSYTYTVDHGEELAKDTLEVTDLITKGTYLKSSGISNLPDTFKNRVFGTNFSTDTAGIEAGTTKDNSYVITHTDGAVYRYVTPQASMATGTLPNIVYFDSSSSSYYICQIVTDDTTSEDMKGKDCSHIVSTSRIAQNDTDTAGVKSFKKSLAMDTAYEMSSSDTYKKAAITWILKDNKISYSDPDFYSYIKESYPDAFDDDGYPIYEGK